MKKPVSKKFQEEACKLELGDICKIESERNLRHGGQPLNGRYGKIISISQNASGEMSVHFELQPTPKRTDRSYEVAKEANRRFQEYGGRRGYSPPVTEKIWIAATALKFVRSEEDEQFKKRLQAAREHAKPQKDFWGHSTQKPGVYNLATGMVEDQGNYAIREALGRVLKQD